MKKFRGLLTNNFDESNVLFCGVKFDGNASVKFGSRYAPDKIRELSYWLPPYSMEGYPLDKIKLFDYGNFESNDYNDLFDYAKQFMQNDKLKFIVGGDHSITIPFQKEFIRKCKTNNKEPVIVHIDAHCDICNEYLGNNYSHACTIRRALDNGLSEENLFMIGIREFEKDGFDYLIKNKNDVHLFTANNILDNGLNGFFKELNLKNNDKYSIYISFDIDSLDACYVPGTGTPETCGLTPYLVRKILAKLGSFDNIDTIDMVEIAPNLDNNDITSWCGLKLIYDFFSEIAKK